MRDLGLEAAALVAFDYSDLDSAEQVQVRILKMLELEVQALNRIAERLQWAGRGI